MNMSERTVMITKDECNSATVLLYSAHLRIFVNGFFLLFPRGFNYSPIKALSIPLGPLQKHYRNGKLKK